MASKKRTKFQIEADRERITSLYLRGVRQVDIAAELGVSQPQVSYDLKKIQEQWRKRTAIDLDEAKQRELARIDELEREYWNAWRRSLGDFKKKRTETRENSKGSFSTSTVEISEMGGNPSYLAGIQWCISERFKVLGIYAAVKQEVKLDVGSLSDEELLAITEA